MQADREKLEADLESIEAAKQRGPLATLRVYMRLSGPGWLQSAITLGGGSLASSLYLGVLAGFSMLWVQPLAMAMGIVMLSAIGYVVLATGERPFGAINRHINPVLGWSWALATLLANMVWALPQYSLATGVIEQNLAPSVFGAEGTLGDFGGKVVIVAAILAATIFVTWSYGRGSRGVRIYERMLKIVVAGIVLCFVGVAVQLGSAEDGLPWGEISLGFVPDFSAFNRPAEGFAAVIGSIEESKRIFWETIIVSSQRDVMISAAATAVGINMTFLLPYTLLARGWNRGFGGLARFDLLTAMLIPFLLATSCVVIASASRFHAEPVPGLVEAFADGRELDAGMKKIGRAYERLLKRAAQVDMAEEFAQLSAAEVTKRKRALPLAERMKALPVAERLLAAMLVKRDANDLAKSLRPLTRDVFANWVFGIGVLGMALSTITILMLISGFVICEMLGVPPEGRALRLGALAAATGALGPFLWNEGARFYVAVPTSVFGMMLLPIAYWTFFFMMNSKRLLGDAMPRGRSRVVWNVLMLAAAGLATLASVWSVWAKTASVGLGCLSGLLGLALVVHFVRRRGGAGGGARRGA